MGTMLVSMVLYDGWDNDNDRKRYGLRRLWSSSSSTIIAALALTTAVFKANRVGAFSCILLKTHISA